MKSVQWLLEDEHWLEALRPASHAKIQVMNQVVCVFFFTALTSGDAYKLLVLCMFSCFMRHYVLRAFRVNGSSIAILL